MSRFFIAAALCGAVTVLLSTPASAFEVSEDHFMCPMETIGEDELNTWTGGLAAAKGTMDSGQTQMLAKAVAACAQKHSWSESDAISVLELNVSIISGLAIDEALLSNGVFAPDYVAVLADKSETELQQILEDPDKSPALKQLSEMMVAELGDELTAEIASDLGAYIAFKVQAHLSMMKMRGLAD